MSFDLNTLGPDKKEQFSFDTKIGCVDGVKVFDDILFYMFMFGMFKPIDAE